MKNILANLFVNPDISDILELWFFGKLWKDSRHVSVPVALERRENTQEGDRDLFDLIENGAKTNSTSKTIKTKKWLKAKTNSLSKAIKKPKNTQEGDQDLFDLIESKNKLSGKNQQISPLWINFGTRRELKILLLSLNIIRQKNIRKLAKNYLKKYNHP